MNTKVKKSGYTQNKTTYEAGKTNAMQAIKERPIKID
jgi:hypothetical protein